MFSFSPSSTPLGIKYSKNPLFHIILWRNLHWGLTSMFVIDVNYLTQLKKKIQRKTRNYTTVRTVNNVNDKMFSSGNKKQNVKKVETYKAVIVYLSLI